MVILVSSKNEEDPIKIEGARVATILLDADLDNFSDWCDDNDIFRILQNPKLYS